MSPRLRVLLALLPGAAAVPRGLEAILQQIAINASAKYNCSYSIAYRDAEGIATAAYGTVDFDTGRQARTTDSYAFGSVTKVLTGASILKLAAEGALSLDDEVAPLVDPIIAEMAKADPSQGFSSMADLWGAQNVSGTTIRQLLGMGSGVPDFDTATPCYRRGMGSNCTPLDPLRSTLYKDPTDSWDPMRLMSVPWVAHQWRGPCQHSFAPQMKMHRRPFCYSSTNFMLLGLVLAAHAKESSWDALKQASVLPEYLQDKLQFARTGSPADYTPVHGYDRTSYNLPPGQKNDHDNWKVDGVFSGWTASDIVAEAAAIANLTWEVYGPPASIAPRAYVNMMIPGPTDVYGLATFNLRSDTGQKSDYGIAYGHLGATYGYQSVTAYFPKLNFAITVATNIERDFQEQPAEAMCFAYNAAAGLLLNRTINCKYEAKGYYDSGCQCDQIVPQEEPIAFV